MHEIAPLLWHVPTVMIVLLFSGLLMGQRHVGELSVFDLLTGIAIGAVAGAGVVDPTLPHEGVLASMLGLAFLHYVVTWMTTKWGWFGRVTTFEPLVVVRHGQPVRSAMRRVRLALSDLLPLLREKDVFDLREVEYAVLEPDGKVTVLRTDRKPAYKGLPRAVILDGRVDRPVLKNLGWNEGDLKAELQRQGYAGPKQVFLATLDESGTLVVTPPDTEGAGPVNH